MQSDLIGDIVRREGGFVDNPEDRGGPTKYGVTVKSLSAWRGHPCTRTDVLDLEEGEARAILSEIYVARPNFDKINDAEVRNLVVDWGVNSGPTNAIRALQCATDQQADGVLGPNSIAAVNRVEPRKLFNQILAARLAFIGKLISRDPSQSVFAEGWMNRLAEFLA